MKFRPRLFILVIFLVAGRPFPVLALDKPFDHSVWDQFLKKFVDAEGNVDYAAVKQDPSILKKYLKQLAAIEEEDVKATWPREELMALGINAFNVAVINAVIQHYPLKSIQDISGVWEDNAYVSLGEEGWSLNRLRFNFLMDTFRDEKMHAALACGAKSCPRLRQEAYTGGKVEGQLFLAARDFVTNARWNQVEPGSKELKLSRLFKWYAKDFRLDFGTAENDRGLSDDEMAILSFVAHYSDDPAKIEDLEKGNYKIKYLPFDWSLNDVPGRSETHRARNEHD